MDITQTDADRLRLSSELMQAQAEIIRLESILQRTSIINNYDLPQDIILIQDQLLEKQLEEHHATLSVIANTVIQREAELASVSANIKGLRKVLPMIQKKARIVKQLEKEGATSQFDLLAYQEEKITKEQELISQEERQKEIMASLEADKERLKATEAEFYKTILAELAEKKIRSFTLEKELSKAEERHRLQRLVSPITGTVQELQVHTVGGVVTPAQELLKIVPISAKLEAEIMIENKDIGFVEEGQDVAIKLEAFPFTKYGMLDGVLVHISHDAIQDKERGLIFAAIVSIEQNHIMIGNKKVMLSPGLSLTAEIKTGHRRIIEYFLSPILKYKAEIIRER